MKAQPSRTKVADVLNCKSHYTRMRECNMADPYNTKEFNAQNASRRPEKVRAPVGTETRLSCSKSGKPANS